jgi:cytoskeleton protein RodZ
LDESALLGALTAPTEPRLTTAEVQTGGETFPTTGSNQSHNIYLLSGALLVAIILAVFEWSHRNSSEDAKTVIKEVKLPEVVLASAPVAASSVPDALSVVQSKLVPTKVIEPEVAAAPPVSSKVAVHKEIASKEIASKEIKTRIADPFSVPKAVSVPLVSSKPEQPIEQLHKRPIHIVFMQDAWMEIIDKNGDVLLSRMTPAGNEKWVGGGRRAPYKVSIGKVSAVRIYYKGNPLDMSQYKQSGLVQLELE